MENCTTNGENAVAPLLDASNWNGEYIVVLKRMNRYPHITHERVEAHKRWISGAIGEQEKQVGYYLDFPIYNSLMYMGKFSHSILDQIRRSAEVKCVAKVGISRFRKMK